MDKLVRLAGYDQVGDRFALTKILKKRSQVYANLLRLEVSMAMLAMTGGFGGAQGEGNNIKG